MFWNWKLRAAQRNVVTCIVVSFDIIADVRDQEFGGTSLSKMFPNLGKVVLRICMCRDMTRGAEKVLHNEKVAKIIEEVKKGEKSGLQVGVVIVVDD